MSQRILRKKTPTSGVAPPREPVDRPVNPDVEVTLIAVSLRVGPPASRTAALADALDTALHNARVGPRVVLLAGARCGWPSKDAVVMARCQEHSAAVIFERSVGESGIWTAYNAIGRHLGVETAQVLADGASADRNPDQVASLLQMWDEGGERTFRLSGVDVGLICCGESSMLRCPRDGGVVVRGRPDGDVFAHAPVTLNGAHSNMKRWRELNTRFAYLSRENRVAVYITNNEAQAWGGSVRVYVDGHLLANGEGVVGRHARARVRVVRDEEHDRFRAIVLHAPGSMLQPR